MFNFKVVVFILITETIKDMVYLTVYNKWLAWEILFRSNFITFKSFILSFYSLH